LDDLDDSREIPTGERHAWVVALAVATLRVNYSALHLVRRRDRGRQLLLDGPWLLASPSRGVVTGAIHRVRVCRWSYRDCEHRSPLDSASASHLQATRARGADVGRHCGSRVCWAVY